MTKTIGIIIGSAFAILVLGGFVAQSYAQQKLSETLQLTTPKGDSIRFGKLSLDLLTATLRLDSVDVRWIVSNEEVEDNLTYELKGRVSQLELKGINFFDYLFNNVCRVKHLNIRGPELQVITLSQSVQTPPDSVHSSRDKSAFNVVLKAKEVYISPSRIVYRKPETEEVIWQIDSFTLRGKDLHFPSVQDANPLPDDINWAAARLKYQPAGGLEELHIAHLQGNALDSTLQLRGVQLNPRYSADEQWKKDPTKSGQIKFNIAGAEFENLDWRRLILQQQLSATTVDLDKLHVEVLENEALTISNQHRRKPLYQETFRSVQMPIRLDTIRVKNGQVVYRLIPRKGGERGALDFTDLYATMYNLTNDSAQLAQGANTGVDIRTRFNAESQLTAHFDFALGSADHTFAYRGELQPLSLTTLNSILVAAAPMQIAQGTAQEFTFDVRADQQVAKGELLLRYDRLKIKWQDDHSRIKALGQKVFMREANPKDGELRRGKVYFERLPGRSFWHYFYQSLLSGVRSTTTPNLFLPDQLEVD